MCRSSEAEMEVIVEIVDTSKKAARRIPAFPFASTELKDLHVNTTHPPKMSADPVAVIATRA